MKFNYLSVFVAAFKGTLEVGKLADFVVLEKDPFKIAPKEIGRITILETVKEGKTVYTRE